MTEARYWIGFNLLPGIGPARFRRLLSYFGSAEVAWKASARDWAAAGIDHKTIDSASPRRGRLDLEREVERVAQAGAHVVTWEDGSYPPLLKHVADAPPVLYVRGSIQPADELSIAVVGTRRASVYGKQVCERLVQEIAGRGVTVVSGLARGIDAIAHRAALAAGGRTIAVVGCGADVVYPPEHAGLARDVVANGAIVSEYPIGSAPDAGNFPPRNRIISGMTRSTLVVEAGETSGALITANYAVEQGRDVLAVPGSILSPGCVGTNRLIQQGAKLIQDVGDIFDELNVVAVGQQLELRSIAPDDPVERSLLDVLTAEPAHIDEIVRLLSLPVSTVSGALAMLELKGRARHVGGMNYVTTGR
jgi:DNA processing protein